ncbi:DUF3265 domain-containing protein [Vibrio parahaemolyticus]|nr:DUF3265 domain-containing protein [Vibrio parahaemolyticus]MCR9731772.1 DUF3265 domain-containing protein [Vibrio parahaemolyticus]MCR9752943.1 DUF3265 domain-containing protein [Vibrio parahaemolyticus]MCR9787011.1 DUF3265 domain-containing protein [Vibrio parahaemolyticus]MCR9860213.1 DUF3265 domain-containing protein [Vibrio parahaemolyticus]MCZ6417663.1 DUF3265 domain-containing protein [Vibrio parahaemolyticus]
MCGYAYKPLKIRLTSCSRGIHNAWHFYYALIFVFKVVCSNFGISVLRCSPLNKALCIWRK